MTVTTESGNEVEVSLAELVRGYRRLYCANGTMVDGQYYHRDEVCHGDGYIDVPLAYLDKWKGWLFASEDAGWGVIEHAKDGWRVAQHSQHGHESVHTLVFCCGPCNADYLLRMYREPPPGPGNAEYAAEVLRRLRAEL